MTGQDDWISETELHAYLDGELEAERCRAIELRLAEDAELAARLQSYRRHAAVLRRAYGPLLARPLPAGMIQGARAVTRPRPARLRWALAAAAAILLFVAGAGSGWWARGVAPGTVSTEQHFVDDAVAAHLVYAVEVRHPVEVGSDQEQHLVTWLSKRLALPVKAPDLSAQGYELVGGRLLPSESGPAAQLMYQDASGSRCTLYVRASGEPEETAFRFTSESGVSALYWREGGAAWALIGALPRAELLGLAHTVYRALNS